MCTKLQTANRGWILAFLLGLICSVNVRAQTVEAAVGAAITAGSVTLGNEISRTNSLQSATLGQNTAITAMLSNIQSYEQKMYNYLSEAQGIINSVYTLTKCVRLGSDIITELNECRIAAQNHPQGLIVSSLITTQYSDIVSESGALVSYLTPIVKGSGNNNLLNSAERIRILNMVSTRLYNIYWGVKQLKMNIMRMKWMHLLNEMSPEFYNQFFNTENAYEQALKQIRRAEAVL